MTRRAASRPCPPSALYSEMKEDAAPGSPTDEQGYRLDLVIGLWGGSARAAGLRSPGASSAL